MITITDCIFCRIVAKEVPGQVLYEDEEIVAFKDINPMAPFHALIIPKEHFRDLIDVPENRLDLLGKIQRVAARLAKEHKLDSTGFRIVTNTGPDSGQIVFHIHYHLLGGRPLGRIVSPLDSR